MSQTGLPVNQEGPGLTLVYGWASEERRAQGLPASVQGIDFCTDSGKLLGLEYCPFCGEKIAGSAARVRAHVAKRPAPEVARVEAPPVARTRPSERTVEAPPPSAPVAASRAQDTTSSASLKLLREKLGLSQAELGEKLGLARSSVANYENGRSPLSQRLRKWIAKHEAKSTDGAAGRAA